MRNRLLKNVLLLIPLVLAGCSSPETPPVKEPPAEEAVDPLTEARKKLFDELGIQDESVKVKAENPLPPVLPTPPELPKTDADWPEN